MGPKRGRHSGKNGVFIRPVYILVLFDSQLKLSP
jgi:hypothetical protein